MNGFHASAGGDSLDEPGGAAGRDYPRALDELAALAPEWLLAGMQPEWGGRYRREVDG